MTVAMTTKALEYMGYFGAALWENIPEIPSGSSTIPKKKISTFIPDEKKLEAVTTAIMLITIGMKPTGTKPGVLNNKLQGSAPGFLQGFWRNRQDVGKDDLLDYKVLHIAITFLGNWYKPTSREAQAVLRIQRVTMLGLEKLKATYCKPREKFLVDYIEKYIDRYAQFEKTIQESNVKTLEIPEDKKPSKENDIDKSSEDVDNSEQPQAATLELSSDIFEKEPKETNSSESIFDQQKTLWSAEDLEYVAKMAEEARDYYEANKEELAQGKLKSLESKADEKILEWQEIIEKDNIKRSNLSND